MSNRHGEVKGNNGTRIALGAIVLVALALRLWGIWFGLPDVLHEDEGFEVRRALQLGAGSYNFERFAKGLYFYLLFVEYGLLFLWLKLSGAVSSAVEFAQLHFRDPTLFYLIGRATTAVIGTITVFLTWVVARNAFGIRAAWLAAAFLAVDPLHVSDSHFITVDVPMTCLVVAALFYALRVCGDGTRRDYVLGALYAALAVSAKLPAIIVLVPLLLAHHFRVADAQPDGRGLLRFWRERELWLAAGVFLATYLVTTPGALVHFPGLMLLLARRALAADPGVAAPIPAVAPGTTEDFPDASRALAYLDHIATSMGPLLSAACLAGLAWALVKRTRADVLLLSFAGLYFLSLWVVDSGLTAARYVLPLMPVLAIFGARAIVSTCDAVVRSDAGRRWSIAAIGLALVIPGAIASARHDLLITRKDTRTEAREWFERNVAPGTAVFIDGFNGRVSGQTVQLRKSENSIRHYISLYRGIDRGKARFFETELAAHPGGGYDLEIADGPQVKDFSFYKRTGVRYFVVLPDKYLSGLQKRARFAQLLADLRQDPEARLVAQFEPVPGRTPGPVIEVYELAPAPASSSAESPP